MSNTLERQMVLLLHIQELLDVGCCISHHTNAPLYHLTSSFFKPRNKLRGFSNKYTDCNTKEMAIQQLNAIAKA
jgi:hypothetical protein